MNNRFGRGTRQGRSKLTGAQVSKILSLIEKGKKYDAIARKFGVSKSTISHIKSGRRWAHVVNSSAQSEFYQSDLPFIY